MVVLLLLLQRLLMLLQMMLYADTMRWWYQCSAQRRTISVPWQSTSSERWQRHDTDAGAGVNDRLLDWELRLGMVLVGRFGIGFL